MSRISIRPAVLLALLLPAALPVSAAQDEVPACLALTEYENFCLAHRDCVGLYYHVTNGEVSKGFGWGVMCRGPPPQFICYSHWDTNAGFDDHACMVSLLA